MNKLKSPSLAATPCPEDDVTISVGVLACAILHDRTQNHTIKNELTKSCTTFIKPRTDIHTLWTHISHDCTCCIVLALTKDTGSNLTKSCWNTESGFCVLNLFSLTLWWPSFGFTWGVLLTLCGLEAASLCWAMSPSNSFLVVDREELHVHACIDQKEWGLGYRYHITYDFLYTLQVCLSLVHNIWR